MSLSALLRPPDRARIQTEEHGWRDAGAASDGFAVPGVRLWTTPEPAGIRMRALVDGCGLLRIRLRWRHPAARGTRCLGDAFERAYGDLAWRGLEPERSMPWYVLVHAGDHTDGIGVDTGAGCFATWQVDGSGITLDLDCRSGGVGVRPGARRLEMATVRACDGTDGEAAFSVACRLCRTLCPAPRLPREPVYGANNWYYAYAQTTHAECLDDATRIAAWSDHANRPYMVLDDGWQAGRTPHYNAGPWQAGNANFPDMPGLAAGIRARGARPGIWYRPLVTEAAVPEAWALQTNRKGGWLDHGAFLDPTVEDARELLAADMRRLVAWGFELIKHDFTTYDLLGYWGSGRSGPWIADGWAFHDRSHTSAEVIADLYRLLREAAGSAILLGCNTVGHLAAGTHEIQRTGDDTSGRSWERTRRMGVNTLAFRMPQHEAFFAVDADCVGLTRDVPWSCNRQWLDVLARSGTPLFISAAPDAVGPEQEHALQRACRLAAEPRSAAVPQDWMDTTCPARWRCADGDALYDWTGDDGCPPPGVGPGG